MTKAADVIETMMSMRDEAQRRVLLSFFKTAPGEYGAGDEFLGIKVPATRQVALQAADMPLEEIALLLHHPIHEIRLCALLIMVRCMKGCLPTRRRPEGDPSGRQALVDFYLLHAAHVNNWDLVDLSCPGIIGQWLLHLSDEETVSGEQLLERLSESENMWEQRISMVSTLTLIRVGRLDEACRIAKRLLGHSHDLIHKAVGWMLREVGKVDRDRLEEFLEEHYREMSRTTLRYAIERLPESERQGWLRR